MLLHYMHNIIHARSIIRNFLFTLFRYDAHRIAYYGCTYARVNGMDKKKYCTRSVLVYELLLLRLLTFQTFKKYIKIICAILIF
jgi:hypothetical protein